MISLENIRAICSGRIGIDEPLAKLTSYRLGGPVDLYVEPQSTQELLGLVHHFHEHSMPFIILGNGSNVLISDDGFRGAAISLGSGFSNAVDAEGVVESGAGIKLSTFVDFCINHGYAGVEMLAGIPGSLGGAVIMNASAYGGIISEHIQDVTVLRDDEIHTIAKENCAFRYRTSDLNEDIILSVRFRFPVGDIDELKAVRKELLLRRNASQPTNMPNAGCIFKNPEGLYAARLIQECGLKGYRTGGAEVSMLHANFIVRHPEAEALDIIHAINHVRKVVFEQKLIELNIEIRLVGFSPDVIEPLRKQS